MKEAVKAFKALSDETKLRVLNVLMERECCVCEVMQALDISQSKASRNLSALYDAGFIKLKKDGLWSLYSIDNDGMTDYLTDLVKAAKKAVENSEIAAEDKKRLRKAERVGVKVLNENKQKSTANDRFIKGEEKLNIKVLGPGCAKCHQLEANVKEAVKATGQDIKVELVSDIMKIMEYPILTTPGMVINGKLVSSGKVLTKAEIIALINKA